MPDPTDNGIPTGRTSAPWNPKATANPTMSRSQSTPMEPPRTTLTQPLQATGKGQSPPPVVAVAATGGATVVVRPSGSSSPPTTQAPPTQVVSAVRGSVGTAPSGPTSLPALTAVGGGSLTGPRSSGSSSSGVPTSGVTSVSNPMLPSTPSTSTSAPPKENTPPKVLHEGTTTKLEIKPPPTGNSPVNNPRASLISPAGNRRTSDANRGNRRNVSSAGGHASYSEDESVSRRSTASSNPWKKTGDDETFLESCYYNLVGPLKSFSKYLKRMSPRKKQLLFFVLCEAIAIGALVVQTYFFFEATQNILAATAGSELRLMDQTYGLKLTRMHLIAEDLTTDPALVNYLSSSSGRTPAATADALSLLRVTAKDLQVEVLTLLYPNSTIALNASIKKQRRGEVLDPDGLVSATIAEGWRTNEYVLGYRTMLMTYAEYSKESPVIFRERVSALEETAFNTPADTKGPALVRYVAMPLYSLTDPTELVGALLVGDVVNGKTPICSLTTNTMGQGFAAIYHRDSDDDVGGLDLRGACTSTRYTIRNLGGQSVLTSRFDPTVADTALLAILEQQEHHGSQKIDVHTVGDFVYASKGMPHATVNGQDVQGDEPPPGLLVRGISISQRGLFWKVVQRTLVWMALLILLQFLSLYTSIDSFIKPLERAAHSLRNNKSVDMKTLLSVQLFASYWCRVLANAAISVVCITLIILTFTDGFRNHLLSESRFKVQVGRLLWDVKVSEMRIIAPAAAELDIVNDAMLKPGSIAEKYILSNSTVTWGKVFDPRGIVSETLDNNLQYMLPSSQSYEEYIALDPPHWKERFWPDTTPASALNPRDTKGPNLIRWLTAPVYLSSNTAQTEADGVLLLGDGVAGKTAMQERMLEALEMGYAAMYMRSPGIGAHDLTLLASAYRSTPNSPVQVDEDWVEYVYEVIDECQRLKGEPVSAFRTVRGKLYAVSVVTTPEDRKFTEYGQEPEHTIRHDGPQGYIVYALPYDTVSTVERKVNIFIYVCAALQFLCMVAMNLFAYLPYHSLLKALGQRGFIKATDRPTIRKAIKELAVDPARSLSRKGSRWISSGSTKRSSRVVAPAVSPSPANSPANTTPIGDRSERDRSRSGVDPCAPGGNPAGGLDMA